MAEEKKYRNYTATDIEKYHKGLLSPKEMHDLERAALDDPFLADALEGYAAVPVNASADISELEKKLDERISAKVVPITRSKKGFIWLRAAVAIVLIAGAGLLIYQFGPRHSNKEVVMIPEKKPAENFPSGTVSDSAKFISPEVKTGDVAVITKNKITYKANQTKDAEGYTYSDKAVTQKMDTFHDVIISPTASAANVTRQKKDVASEEKKEILNKSLREDGALAKDNFQKPQDSDSDNFKTNNAFALRKNAAYPTNYFRGRVIDSNNNPLPFANITNTRDNVGTYADASGNFTLVSPDSVLNVQVYSNGYLQHNNVQLKNNVSANKVIMQEDKSLQGLVLSQKTFNANRSPEANMKFEEPEPADGWYNYDTYIVNNIKKPGDVKAKRTAGDVQISFDVSKNGDPTNIKIEKSLCRECDEEAIRLIKEGPKWKRKGKRSRVTVTVPFDQ